MLLEVRCNRVAKANVADNILMTDGPHYLGLEGSGIEGVVPSLVGNMVVEFIYEHLYALCVKLRHI